MFFFLLLLSGRRSRMKKKQSKRGKPQRRLTKVSAERDFVSLQHFDWKNVKIWPVCCFFCLRHTMSISVYLWAAAATFWMIPNTFDNWMYLLSTTTARQAMKNTPKRLPSVTVRSPLGANSPTVDPQADSSVSTPPMETGAVSSEETTTHSVVRLSAKLKRWGFHRSSLCVKHCNEVCSVYAAGTRGGRVPAHHDRHLGSSAP